MCIYIHRYVYSFVKKAYTLDRYLAIHSQPALEDIPEAAVADAWNAFDVLEAWVLYPAFCLSLRSLSLG